MNSNEDVGVNEGRKFDKIEKIGTRGRLYVSQSEKT